MGSDWQVLRIEEIAEKIAMGPFGSNIKVDTFVDDGIPVISGGHLHETRLQDGDFNFVTEEHAARLKNWVFADQCGSKRTFWGSAGRKLAMTLSLR